jgi:nucleoside 2-deoxyribosyltransferase
MKKVYFACSIRSGRDDANLYGELVEYLAERSTVLSEIFADKTLTVQGSPGKTSDIYVNDIAWVKEADVLVAEVTNPSLGVGYEIAKAEEWGKPVLALFRDDGERKLSAMIDGSPYLKVVYYTDVAEAKKAIDAFLV